MNEKKKSAKTKKQNGNNKKSQFLVNWLGKEDKLAKENAKPNDMTNFTENILVSKNALLKESEMNLPGDCVNKSNEVQSLKQSKETIPCYAKNVKDMLKPKKRAKDSSTFDNSFPHVDNKEPILKMDNDAFTILMSPKLPATDIVPESAICLDQTTLPPCNSDHTIHSMEMNDFREGNGATSENTIITPDGDNSKESPSEHLLKQNPASTIAAFCLDVIEVVDSESDDAEWVERPKECKPSKNKQSSRKTSKIENSFTFTTASPSQNLVNSFFMDSQQKRAFEQFESQKRFLEDIKRRKHLDQQMRKENCKANPFFESIQRKERTRRSIGKGENKMKKKLSLFTSTQPHFPGKSFICSVESNIHIKSSIELPCGLQWKHDDENLLKCAKDINDKVQEIIEIHDKTDESLFSMKNLNYLDSIQYRFLCQINNDYFWMKSTIAQTEPFILDVDKQISLSSETWNQTLNDTMNMYNSMQKLYQQGSKDKQWVDKYNPMDSKFYCGNQGVINLLYNWLTEWKHHRVGDHQAMSFNDKLYCYDSDGEEDQWLKKIFLLEGEIGSGKTSAVYSCARELGFEVIEINAGQLRSGKAISELVGEATQSNSVILNEIENEQKIIDPIDVEKKKKNNLSKKVKKARNSFFKKNKDKEVKKINESMKLTLILFEDIDIIFEEDKGFSKALKNLSKYSLSPIIATCKDIPDDLFNLDMVHEVCQRPSLNQFCMYLHHVSILENLSMNIKSLYRMAQIYQCDIRKALQSLLLWRENLDDTNRNIISSSCNLLKTWTLTSEVVPHDILYSNYLHVIDGMITFHDIYGIYIEVPKRIVLNISKTPSKKTMNSQNKNSSKRRRLKRNVKAIDESDEEKNTCQENEDGNKNKNEISYDFGIKKIVPKIKLISVEIESASSKEEILHECLLMESISNLSEIISLSNMESYTTQPSSKMIYGYSNEEYMNDYHHQYYKSGNLNGVRCALKSLGLSCLMNDTNKLYLTKKEEYTFPSLVESTERAINIPSIQMIKEKKKKIYFEILNNSVYHGYIETSLENILDRVPMMNRIHAMDIEKQYGKRSNSRRCYLNASMDDPCLLQEFQYTQF